MTERRPHRRRSKWIAAVKLVVVVLMMVLVVRVVPWRDELRHRSDGGERQFRGLIEGEWTSERIRFRFDEPQPGSALPRDWGADRGAIRSLELSRSETTSWQPGIRRVFHDVESRGLAIALLLATLGLVVTALRWWRLLGVAGCPSTFFLALRLTFIGFFFNIVVPGLTGGDVVKAVMAARTYPERRAAAAISVLVDRLVGMLVLVVMGTVALALQDESFPYPRTPIYLALIAAMFVIPAYLSTTVRRRVGFGKVMDRLARFSLLRQVDDAIALYSRAPREMLFALAASTVNQCCILAALIVLGRSFGDASLTLIDYVVVCAVGSLASAVPLTPGGVGLTEILYGQMSEALGGSWTIGFAVAITWRLCMLVIGLVGGLLYLTPGGRMSTIERAEFETSKS